MQHSHLQHRCSSLQGMELGFPRVKEAWERGERGTEPEGCRMAPKPSHSHSTEQTHVGFYPLSIDLGF